MILALAFTAALGGATAGAGGATVELVNDTGSHLLSISVDGRSGCQAPAKGGRCSFAATTGFHHFLVTSRSGERMEKSLYITADNGFVWTVDGKDLPGGDRWSGKTAAADGKLICKMQLTNSGIARKACATKAQWDAENTRTRQDLMVTQRPFVAH